MALEIYFNLWQRTGIAKLHQPRGNRSCKNKFFSVNCLVIPSTFFHFWPQRSDKENCFLRVIINSPSSKSPVGSPLWGRGDKWADSYLEGGVDPRHPCQRDTQAGRAGCWGAAGPHGHKDSDGVEKGAHTLGSTLTASDHPEVVFIFIEFFIFIKTFILVC